MEHVSHRQCEISRAKKILEVRELGGFDVQGMFKRQVGSVRAVNDVQFVRIGAKLW